MVQNDLYGLFNTTHELWFYTSDSPSYHTGSIWEDSSCEDYWSSEKLTLFTYELTIAHIDTFRRIGTEAQGVHITVPNILNKLILGEDGLYRVDILDIDIDYTNVIL